MNETNTIETLTSEQLTVLASLKQEIETRQLQMMNLLNNKVSEPVRAVKARQSKTGPSDNRRGPVTAEGRARIAEAQKRRWAAQKAGQK